jgi:undecaprenyl-diphosphatase
MPRKLKLPTRVPEGWVLLIVLLAAAVLWGAAELRDELGEGDTLGTDRAILMAFRSASDPADPIGPRWFEELARDVTALGSFGVLMFIIAASVVFLFIAGQKSDAFVMMAATGGGIAATSLLKIFFARTRPETVHDIYVSSFSFPSGHTMMSAVTYLTLGALFARELKRPMLKAYVMVLAVGVTLLVGISRIYLGVHWPSDVVAGWALGAAWALLCWANANWLEKKKLS